MSFEIELDIFSGRPNPRWILNKGVEEQFLSYLGSLPIAAESQVDHPTALGYRGLVVRSQDHPESLRLTIYKGIVESDKEILIDKNHKIEKLLLESSEGVIDDKLKAFVIDEITSR